MRSGTKPGISTGFAIIEAITVVVILAILASFALPRFVALDGEARRASAKALAGSIQRSAARAHSLYREQKDSPAAVTVPGVTEAVGLTFGFPATAELKKLLPNLQGFSEDHGVYAVEGALDPVNCGVTYVEPAAEGSLPQIILATAGCG